jgi:hypothetical protein
MRVEYRSWIALDNMPFADESLWLPFMRHIERTFTELGPIASWDDDSTMVVVLADDQSDPATAAECATRTVSETLRATNLSDRVPRVLEVEPVDDRLAA